MSDTPKQPEVADRLAKVIARAGLCSRRDAEGWIADGRISVNGKKVITPAFNVTSKDKIEVDGLPLAARQGTRVWLYNKPAGLVVTEKDPEGRPTIFEELDRKGLPRVLTVGRLDINTEGLLLLTNDGGLKRVLELPSTGWLRRYRVRAFGSVTQAQLDSLKQGVTVDGIQYGPITATLEREQGSNVWMVLGLREGKNREVKNVLGSLGLEVNRLIRISYGPFQLGELAEGAVEMVKSRMLRDQLGKKLAESAGVDFESDAPDMVQPAPRDDRPVRSPRDRAPLRPRPAGRDAGPRAGEDRPIRARRVHFEDDEGRAPESYEPKGAGRQRPDRDDQPARSFGKPADRSNRPDRSEGRKPYGDRPKRDFGDKPKRDYGDRPARSFGDKPARGPRPEGRFGDRPQRSFGDKPARGGFSDRPKRDFGDRPKRDFGDKPARGSFGDRPARGPRPKGRFEDRPKRDYGDRPQRPYGDRPTRGPRPEGGFEGRPPRRDGAPGGKPFGDRKPFAGKRDGAKPYGDRPQGGRPQGDRAGGPQGDRSGRPGGKPFGGRPGGARPAGGRPGGPRKPRG
ncbi:23S rRNA pseudouridine2605 synthase [Devosia lucknowensis]|uniref:Pseudouridine synthase n=1 Tax=Devosia lucknowensis TaxID=1096929 RepID=A0A1Y6E9H3_9HYPH|nr:pseudouridine synthase [Devosia lucknowensis]SMQ59248.1 23S rRNA pseudouridine2605 synthase [Devosia lucknowensis]